MPNISVVPSRRRVLSGAAAIAFCGRAPRAWSADAGAPIAVRIVQAAETLPTLPLLYARAGGLFEKAGLAVTWLPLTPNSAQIAAILDTGEADFGQAAASAPLAAQAVGKDITGFAALSRGAFLQLVLTKDALAKRPGLTPASPIAEKIRALKGLRIAISPPGNTANLIFHTMLASAGLDADRDVETVPNSNLTALPPTARLGRADGFFLNPPYTTMAVAQGWGEVWIDLTRNDVGLFGDSPQTVLVARRDTLAAKAEAAKRVIAAMRMAMADIASAPANVRDLVRARNFEDIDPAIFAVAFQDVLPSLNPGLTITRKGYAELTSEIVVTDQAGRPANVAFERAFDFTLAAAR